MKKHYLATISALLLLWPAFSHAQITLTAADMPQPGMVIHLGRDTGATIDIGTASSEAQIWDFSGLQVSHSKACEYFLAGDQPQPSLFTGANLVEVQTSSNLVPVTNYYFSGPDSLVLVGMDIGFTFWAVASMEPPRKLWQFPATYGLSYIDYSTQRLVLDSGGNGDSVVIISSFTREIGIDAFGTVRLPSGDFPALRQREDWTWIDSSYLFTEGALYLFATSAGGATEHAWLSPDARGFLVRAGRAQSTDLLDVTFFQSLVDPSVTAPVADFSAVLQPDGATVQYTDLSTNAPTGWIWNFGDGATSTEQNPQHTYTAANTYQVCLTATNAGGGNVSCQSVLIMPVSAVEASGPLALRVAPNPARDNITLTLPSTVSTQIVIANSLGQDIYAATLAGQLLLDVSQWPAGIYTYRLHDAQGRPLGTGRLQVLR